MLSRLNNITLTHRKSKFLLLMSLGRSPSIDLRFPTFGTFPKDLNTMQGTSHFIPSSLSCEVFLVLPLQEGTENLTNAGTMQNQRETPSIFLSLMMVTFPYLLYPRGYQRKWCNIQCKHLNHRTINPYS